ncbi:class II glutamine amidotransferase [Streptomyces goshikiensis]|uniref:class II glutamine amidotransferase n=1 Tax=Streptomyces goshikiensis TaxID=1942 RepID=UPI0036C38CE3
MSPARTHGDGFGIGWYSPGGDGIPAVYREAGPAWNSRNLLELGRNIHSQLFFAHVRSATGTPVQQTNCHPFRHDRWLWMHNGAIAEFQRLRRDLMMAVSPSLFPLIEGSTDSEIMFFLAVTFGLYEDVPGAVAQMAWFVEQTALEHGVPEALQMTVAVSDGVRIWAFRYSTAGRSRSLFCKAENMRSRRSCQDSERPGYISAVSRLIVSEPLDELSEAWVELPEASYLVVQSDTALNFLPFAPNPLQPHTHIASMNRHMNEGRTVQGSARPGTNHLLDGWLRRYDGCG